MKSRTARWDSAVLQSHVVTTTAAVLLAGVPVPGASSLSIVGGNVTQDRTAAQLGRSDMQFAEPYRIPTLVSGGALSPYGYELYVRSGIAYADGTSELMDMGVYPIQDTDIDGVTLLTSISAVDRTQALRDAKFTDDYLVPGSILYTTAMQQILTDRCPWFPPMTFPTLTFTTPTAGLALTLGTDPFDILTDMAAGQGCEFYFNGTGVPSLRPEPLFTQAPAWTISDGDGGALVSANLKLSRGPAFNAVTAIGENSSNGTVYNYTSYDLDPTSPTYYFGSFGKKPKDPPYSSAMITSTAMAQSAADALMQAQRGVARSLNMSALPNRALETGDPVLIKRTGLSMNEIHLIDSLTFDLSVGVMTGSSRARAQQ